MKYLRSRRLFLESKNQAEKILKNLKKSNDEEDYITLKNKCMEMFKSLNFLGMMTKFRYEQKISIDELLDLLKWLKFSNKPKNKLSQDPLKFDKFEDIKDEIIIIDNNKKTNDFIKELNGEQKRLLRKSKKTTLNEFRNWAIKIHEFKNKNTLFNKISKSKSIEDLIESMKDFVYKNADTPTYNSKINDIKSLAELVYENEEQGILVARIDSYEASNKLGSSSWCISTSNTTFKDYVTDKDNTQFFIWDFKRDIADPLFLTGLTYRIDMTLRNAHNMNDVDIKNELPTFIIDIIKFLSPIQGEELITRKKNTEIADYEITKKEGLDLIDSIEELGSSNYRTFDSAYHILKKIKGIRPEDEELNIAFEKAKRGYCIEIYDKIIKDLGEEYISSYGYKDIFSNFKAINRLDIDDIDDLLEVNFDNLYKETLIEQRDSCIENSKNNRYDGRYRAAINDLKEIEYEGDMSKEIKQMIDELNKEHIEYKREVFTEYGDHYEEMLAIIEHENLTEEMEEEGEDFILNFDYEGSNHYELKEITYNGSTYRVGSKKDAEDSLYDYHRGLIEEGGVSGDMYISDDCIDLDTILEDEEYFKEDCLEEISDIEEYYDSIKDEEQSDEDRNDSLDNIESLLNDIYNSQPLIEYIEEDYIIDGEYEGNKVYRFKDDDGDYLCEPFILLSDNINEYIEDWVDKESKRICDDINDDIKSDPLGNIISRFGVDGVLSPTACEHYLDIDCIASNLSDSDDFSSLGENQRYEEYNIGSTTYVVVE